MMSARDFQRLFNIRMECDDIADALKVFGDTFNIFVENKHFRKSVCMSLANIWENLKELSEESRIVLGEDTYKGARAMRNYISHGYGGVDFTIVWETVHTNIPILDKNCHMLLELVCGCPLPCEFNKNDTKTCTKNTRYREGECVFK